MIKSNIDNDIGGENSYKLMGTKGDWWKQLNSIITSTQVYHKGSRNIRVGELTAVMASQTGYVPCTVHLSPEDSGCSKGKKRQIVTPTFGQNL